MPWIYHCGLYDSKYQAECLAKRMHEDWWMYGFEQPSEVTLFKTSQKRYGVRYKFAIAAKKGSLNKVIMK